MGNERLIQQIEFIIEVDKLKTILRQSRTIQERKRENDAEHSWHLTLMAIILQEHANADVEILRVLKMLIIHDIVEIDAGDTFAYDEHGHEDKTKREEKAFQRIYNLLPEDQYRELYQLWREFEDRLSPESKFAASLDRLHPMLLNFHTEGATWKQHGICRDQVNRRNSHIAEGSSELWEYAQTIIEEACERGFLKE